jgi:PAS domain S-box-containing protein
MLDKSRIHPSYHIGLAKVAIRLGIMIGILLLSWLVAMPESLRGIANYQPLHSFLETISIVISGLIFAVIWNSLEQRKDPVMLLMGCGFLGVALLDFTHMMSFQGMPDFIIPSSTEKAINFWLSARLMAVLTLLAASVTLGKEIKIALNRYALLSITLLIVALVHWLFLYHSDWMPKTFIAEQGLTAFKKNSEYFIIGLNLLAIGVLLRRMRQPSRFNAPALLGALAATGLSEFFFTLYGSFNDIFMLLGHVYKIVAYLFLYQVVFVEAISRPFHEINTLKSKLDKTQQLASLGSWELDLVKNQLSWSDEIYRLYGLLPQESPTYYEAFLDHVHPDDRALVDTAYTDSLSNGVDGYEIEHRLIHALSGEVRYVHEKCEHIKDAAGKVILSRGMMHDITELKQTQLALQSSFAELSFQKRALDEHAIVSITDAHGEITYVNDKFSVVSGYSREELMGQNHSLLNSGEHSQTFFKDLWRTIAGGKTWHGEIKNRKKDGEPYWIASTIVPTLNEAGLPISYIAIRTDITNIKKTEALLRRSQKMESIGELAGGIAHDFNNLLGIIVGNLDLISVKLDSDGKLKQRLETAQNAAFRGASMTRRLLNFSRQSDEAHSPVNIGKVISEIKELISKSLTASIAIEIYQADDLWMAELNPDDFEDVLINLSLNARDAMPNGGSLIIEVTNTVLDARFMGTKDELKPGEYVEVAISDTGTGMDKEITKKIFDPFFTTKVKGEGTGLGLSMVYGFVQRAHGHISVYSEVGIGTTFRMYLPHATRIPGRVKSPVEVGGSLPKGSETVLIVDDEEELAAVAQIILQELGYTTICTKNAHEAQQILEHNNNINLVFSDVVMPGGMSGFDLADVVAEQYPMVKMLLTSGFTGKINRSSRANKLIGKTLLKPYRDIELAHRVREILDEIN